MTKVKGLKSLCSMTRDMCCRDDFAVRCYYDINNNKVFGKYFTDSNSYAIFDDPNIYEFWDTSEPMTQAEILEELEYWKYHNSWILYPMESTPYFTYFGWGAITSVEPVYTKDGKYFIYGNAGTPIDVTEDKEYFIKIGK